MGIHRVNTRKYTALINYTQAAGTYWRERSYLELLGKCIDNGFLTQKGSEFLQELIETKKLDYLTWSFKTPWVRKKIALGACESAASCSDHPTLFDYGKLDMPSLPAIEMPLHMLAKTPSQSRLRAT
jgi:hypothetical protein